LEDAISDIDLPETIGLVVFGSLARGEWTNGSDVDWTLLINGPSDPEHFRLAIDIAERLRQDDFKLPGESQTFGTLASSHELVHHIGGEEDTNRNMTRRVLLLLESCSIGDDREREKVVRAILNRYIICGPGLIDPAHPRLRVPRFLLNDVVRMWRTFAVDYAAKKWKRSNEGWALRNAKLRIPRKLTFVKGLLMCLDCELFGNRPPWSEVRANSGFLEEQLLVGCAELVNMTPLDLLARTLLELTEEDLARAVLEAYDDYLALIDDPEKRNHLDSKVDFENAMEDDVFGRVREISHRFAERLECLFFKTPELDRLTQKYGLF
jgi:predicted nucleotidyltransferase